MISLGGWLADFSSPLTAPHKITARIELVLGRVEIMDYYVDRLDTLHPRLKKTEFVATITSQIKSLRDLAAEAQGRPPTEAEVKKMRTANATESVALGPVDSDGKILFLDAVTIPPRRFLAAVDDANVRTFRGVVDHFLEETHERFPESASRLGLDEFNARLGRNDEGSYRAQVRLLERTLNTMEKMPEASFSGDDWLDRRAFLAMCSRSCSMPETFSVGVTTSRSIATPRSKPFDLVIRHAENLAPSCSPSNHASPSCQTTWRLALRA